MEEMKTLQVLAVDDHKIFLDGLRHILAGNNIHMAISEALSGQEALELLAKNTYDAAVLDIDMPGMNGLKVLERVKELYPRLPVLMMSMFPEKDEKALRAFELGADGYLNKSCKPVDFLHAVERIVAKESCFSGDFLEYVTRYLLTKKPPPPANA
jgi:two-component system invasion response regulator UvrY